MLLSSKTLKSLLKAYTVTDLQVLSTSCGLFGRRIQRIWWIGYDDQRFVCRGAQLCHEVFLLSRISNQQRAVQPTPAVSWGRSLKCVYLLSKGKRDLTDCVRHYFKEERLEDYKCAKCNQVGSTTRQLELTSLPPVWLLAVFLIVFQVLSLHFLLFVYDKDTMLKKKLFDDVSFPQKFNSDRKLINYR